MAIAIPSVTVGEGTTGLTPNPLSSPTAFTSAQVTFDRTVAGGLNSIAAGVSVEVLLSYQTPGGVQTDLGGETMLSGITILNPNKPGGGGTVNSDGFTISRGSLFPSGTKFDIRVIVTGLAAGQTVTIGGGTSNVVLS